MQEENVMGLFGKKSFFPYVGEIGNDVMEEICGTVARARGYWGFPTEPAGERRRLRSMKRWTAFWRTAGCRRDSRIWRMRPCAWGAVRTCALCGAAVEMEGAGENAGNVDGTNGNTMLLLYNMLENIDRKPEKQKYFPVA